MKICFLTQTATDLSDFYKDFFAGYELFFVTFKKKNLAALDFVPNSTWSDGRNTLWEKVKGQYDYYIFIDDDLRFFSFNRRVVFSPYLSYLWAAYWVKGVFDAYQPATGAYFIERLHTYLETYKPEVATVINMHWDKTTSLALSAMRRGSFVKRLGHFDAQFTVFSQYAASKLLPYDNNVSGWWSAQIPVYLYAHHVFGAKAINIHGLAVGNTHSVGAYRPGYDGLADCKEMLAEIDQVTGKDYTRLAGGLPTEPVDVLYGEEVIRKSIPKPGDQEDYKVNYAQHLQGLERLMHPAIQP